MEMGAALWYTVALMLKLCVILFFLSSFCWADGEEDEPVEQEKVACYTRLIEGLKAEIVERAPDLLNAVGGLREDLRKINNLETISRNDMDEIAIRIEAVELEVRGLRWAPEGLPEHMFSTAHFTVRDASHDLKNALLVARLDAAEIRDATTDPERRLILKSIQVNLELADECLKTVVNPTTSPKRLFSVRELFKDLEVLLDGLPNKVVLTCVRPEVGIAVRASRTQILRLVQNLVLNAAEAMPNGGEIKLSAEVSLPQVAMPVTEGPQLEGGLLGAKTVTVQQGTVVDKTPYVAIKVTDNGPGIEKSRVGNMFVTRNTTKASTGVNPRGVGLSSVLSLALANNGFIQADSELGKGTEIQAIFPLVNREMTDQMEQEINVPSIPGQIVIIDDQRSIRYMIATVLKAKGIPSVAFSNSLSALEFCRRHKGDVRLILLDQHLNDGSTMESNVDDLHAEGITAPIVASSGNPTPDSILVASSFAKPFAIDPFMELLETLAPSPARSESP